MELISTKKIKKSQLYIFKCKQAINHIVYIVINLKKKKKKTLAFLIYTISYSLYFWTQNISLALTRELERNRARQLVRKKIQS